MTVITLGVDDLDAPAERLSDLLDMMLADLDAVDADPR